LATGIRRRISVLERDIHLIDAAVSWLLEPGSLNPGVRYHALRHLLGLAVDDDEVLKAQEMIMQSGPVPIVLAAQHPEGYWARPGGSHAPSYTSHNGHMFSCLSKTVSMGLRLPKEEREAFLEKYNTTLYKSCGAIMKEHVTGPDEILQNTEELKGYLDLGYEYIKTLKPKPTKKRSGLFLSCQT